MFLREQQLEDKDIKDVMEVSMLVKGDESIRVLQEDRVEDFDCGTDRWSGHQHRVENVFLFDAVGICKQAVDPEFFYATSMVGQQRQQISELQF